MGIIITSRSEAVLRLRGYHAIEGNMHIWCCNDPTMEYGTASRTAAISDYDYSSISRTATIPLGATTTSREIPITNDAHCDSNKTPLLKPPEASALTITDSQRQCTIIGISPKAREFRHCHSIINGDCPTAGEHTNAGLQAVTLERILTIGTAPIQLCGISPDATVAQSTRFKAEFRNVTCKRNHCYGLTSYYAISSMTVITLCGAPNST